MVSQIDPIIHQPARLQIMAALAALEADARVEFTFLRDRLALTDGNLGSHLAKLERAGYIRQYKGFASRKPRTHIGLTRRGRRSFEDHVEALQVILGKGVK
jgi:DNA-binding MarR family transcriptional regulator